jgi:poly-beta-1,6-N-acetyl-D-glucosamine synthase
MYFLSFFSFLISTIYFSIILSFLIGWNRIKEYRKDSSSPFGFFISVLVPFKNEAKNIVNLINSIKNQTLASDHFELLLIDDNSTDESMRLALHNTLDQPQFQCIKLLGKTGKKNAIKLGVENAKGHLIVTTDADCTHPNEWLETIYSYYKDYRPKLLIGPVFMQGRSHFEKIQCLDFFSLMASTAGACGINRPIMCNGSNLAFEKETFTKLQDPFKQFYESGDDIFLLHAIKHRFPGKVTFIKSNKALVMTNAEISWRDFLRQRIRWASKSKAYTDRDTIITAVVVLLMNLTLLANLFLSFVYRGDMLLFIFQLSIKSIVDFILLFEVSAFYKIKKSLYYFLPTQIFNIFILPIVAISGFIHHVKWK